MRLRFVSFFSVVVTVFALAAIYVGTLFVSRFPWLAGHMTAVWTGIAIFVLSQVMGPFMYRAWDKWPQWASWILYWLQGVFLCLFVYTLAADLLTWVAGFFLNDSTRETWSQFILLGAGILAFVSGVIGSWQTLCGPCIKNVTVPLANLPPECDGLRIVQISDLHVGPTIGRRYAAKVVAMANSLQPDILALTGDFIDGVPKQLRDGVAPLADLRSTLGAFFVPGNHEYYWNAPAWIQEFSALGIRSLVNEHTVVTFKGQPLVIAGVTDYTAGRMLLTHASDPQKAAAGAPVKVPKILLAHQPASAPAAADAGFDLQLSGHTHGGQFFPFNFVVKFMQLYDRGLNRHKNMWVYVNCGTGYWGPPMRFLVPSEITVLTLSRA